MILSPMVSCVGFENKRTLTIPTYPTTRRVTSVYNTLYAFGNGTLSSRRSFVQFYGQIACLEKRLFIVPLRHHRRHRDIMVQARYFPGAPPLKISSQYNVLTTHPRYSWGCATRKRHERETKRQNIHARTT